jgi:hypothetical protein
MLMNSDLELNFKTFRIASALGLIPAEFEPSSWRMRPTEKKWKILFFRMWVGLVGLYGIWLLVRAGGSLKGANRDSAPINLIVATGFGVVWFYPFFMFLREPQLTEKLFNEFLLLRNPSVGKIPLDFLLI